MKKDIDFIPRNQQDRILIYQTELLENILELLTPIIIKTNDKSVEKTPVKKTRSKRGGVNVSKNNINSTV